MSIERRIKIFGINIPGTKELAPGSRHVLKRAIVGGPPGELGPPVSITRMMEVLSSNEIEVEERFPLKKTVLKKEEINKASIASSGTPIKRIYTYVK